MTLEWKSLFPSLYLYFLFVDPLLLYFDVVVFLLTACVCLHQEEANQPKRRPPSPVTGQTTSQQLNMPFVVIHLSGPTPSIASLVHSYYIKCVYSSGNPDNQDQTLTPQKQQQPRHSVWREIVHNYIQGTVVYLCPKWRRFRFNLSSDCSLN